MAGHMHREGLRTPSQGGFRWVISTIVHIFVLHCLMMVWRQGKKSFIVALWTSTSFWCGRSYSSPSGVFRDHLGHLCSTKQMAHIVWRPWGLSEHITSSLAWNKDAHFLWHLWTLHWWDIRPYVMSWEPWIYCLVYHALCSWFFRISKLQVVLNLVSFASRKYQVYDVAYFHYPLPVGDLQHSCNKKPGGVGGVLCMPALGCFALVCEASGRLMKGYSTLGMLEWRYSVTEGWILNTLVTSAFDVCSSNMNFWTLSEFWTHETLIIIMISCLTCSKVLIPHDAIE